MKQHVKTLFLGLLLCIGQSLYAQVAFRHVTSAANVNAHITTLDYPQLNGSPNAMLFILPNYNLNGAEATGQDYKQNAGVWYDAGRSRWTIFNQNTKEPMPLGMTFNVMIAPPNNPNCFTFTVTQASINGFGNGAVIDHAATNGKTDAMLLVTQNRAGVYNDASQILFYNVSKWAIANNGYDAYWRGETTDTRCLMPVGARFNVMVIEKGVVPGFPNAQAFQHTATAANTIASGNSITFLEQPGVAANPGVTLFATAYWGHSDSERKYASQASGPYNEGPLVARYDHPTDAWNYKNGYWALLNGNGVKMQERAKVFVVAVGAKAQGAPSNTISDEVFAPNAAQRDTASLLISGLVSSKPARILVEIVNGYVVFEGDIVLGKTSKYFKKVKGKWIQKSGTQNTKNNRDAATPNLDARWPNGIIPFVLPANHPRRADILSAISIINRLENICLRPRTNETDFISFTNRSGNCFSQWIGRMGGSQEVSISTCSIGSIQHELLHVAGMFHEHTRSNRDNFVRINWANLRQEANVLFQYQREEGTLSACPYDYGSIMHYPLWGGTFAINPSIDILTPLQPVPAGVMIGQRNVLSPCDIAGLRSIYPNAIGCNGGGGNTFPCPVAFSQENYQGQRFEMCGRGPFNIPFEVKSIQIPVGWEVAYSPHGGECFVDQANTIVSVSMPSLALNPPCTQWPFYVVSRPDGLNKLKITVMTGQDELRGGNQFFFTLHMRNGFSFPEMSASLANGLASNSTYTFEMPVFNSPAENNLNYKDIAGFTIRHDGRPRNGHPFDTYDNWDCRSVLLDWDGRVPKATRFTATRFSGELTSRRYEAY